MDIKLVRSIEKISCLNHDMTTSEQKSYFKKVYGELDKSLFNIHKKQLEGIKVCFYNKGGCDISHVMFDKDKNDKYQINLKSSMYNPLYELDNGLSPYDEMQEFSKIFFYYALNDGQLIEFSIEDDLFITPRHIGAIFSQCEKYLFQDNLNKNLSNLSEISKKIKV